MSLCRISLFRALFSKSKSDKDIELNTPKMLNCQLYGLLATNYFDGENAASNIPADRLFIAIRPKAANQWQRISPSHHSASRGSFCDPGNLTTSIIVDNTRSRSSPLLAHTGDRSFWLADNFGYLTTQRLHECGRERSATEGIVPVRANSLADFLAYKNKFMLAPDIYDLNLRFVLPSLPSFKQTVNRNLGESSVFLDEIRAG
ncbi:hypothetical protein TNCV_1289071 [Trichonephila clavipes]|nr:hypothetical protein TNCV_1289071 [Trichonephila clavipes]